MDLSLFYEVNDPFTGMIVLFKAGGWVFLAAVGLEMFREGWLLWRQSLWDKKITWVLLAVDIPKLNEQSPKAVEQFFDHLTGFDKTPTLQERYIDGFKPTKISLEMVSIDGYIQFLIHTPVRFRDLVEAALYAQYPDAEITEVEDYINGVPKPDDFAKHWPNMEWNMFGFEFGLYRPQPYPIKTWMEFEHSMSQELKDPMAGILEIMSRLGPGEQVWIQWIVTVTQKDREKFQKQATTLVKKLVGDISLNKPKSSFPLGLGAVVRNVTQGVQESLTASIIDPMAFADDKTKERPQPQNKMLYLSPGERSIVEAIDRKATKSIFKVRARMIYFGKQEVFSKARGVSGVYGGIKQFNSNSMNGFAPPAKTKTEAWYILPRWRTRERMRKLLAGYRSRSNWAGHTYMYLNSEELATVWHFPVITVKAQLVQKTETKKSYAPTSLPIREMTSFEQVAAKEQQKSKTQPIHAGGFTATPASPRQNEPVPSQPPENLPFV